MSNAMSLSAMVFAGTMISTLIIGLLGGPGAGLAIIAIGLVAAVIVDVFVVQAKDTSAANPAANSSDSGPAAAS